MGRHRICAGLSQSWSAIISDSSESHGPPHILPLGFMALIIFMREMIEMKKQLFQRIAFAVTVLAVLGVVIAAAIASCGEAGALNETFWALIPPRSCHCPGSADQRGL